MHFKTFQKQDLPRAAMHDGLILSWDTGLGKGLALIAWPLLKVGFQKSRTVRDGTERDCIQPCAPVLLIVPGDLHKQVMDEAWLHFKAPVTPIDSQATFTNMVRLPHSAMINVGPDGRPVLAPGFYITSYTQLSTNNVQSIPDPADCDPQSLMTQFALRVGEHQEALIAGTEIGRDEKGRSIAACKAAVPVFEDVCHCFAWRHILWQDEYQRLGVDPDDTLADLNDAVAREEAAANRIQDPRICGRELAKIDAAKSVLVNLLVTRPCPQFANLGAEQKLFVMREFLTNRMNAYAEGNGCYRDYPVGALPADYDPMRPETDTRLRTRIKCVYSPSLADLSYNAFDAVAIDEGVKMKGEETLVGRAVRSMDPKYRLVLTATPVKNRLPDIFRLAWWAAGGKSEAHPRWPYMDDSAERDKFAETFMVSEHNITREEKARDRGESISSGRFKKLTPQVCNIHRLWKLLGPIVLRRRKQDTGEDIVPRVRHVIRCEMGTMQQRVYQYHLKADYLDKNGQPAIGAQLQALRMAAADPSSTHLKPQGNKPSEECDCHIETEVNGTKIKTPNERCGKCQGSGMNALPPVSGTPYVPKMASCLSLIQEIIARKEQVVVFSAFNDPLDHLASWLQEAGVRSVKLDGRTSQKRRGQLAAVFKRGRSVVNTDAPIPVMLAGVECMAEGHSFHLANNVILIAYSWAYDKFKQALDRVHRMNSAKPVNVYVILCAGTIDARLESLIQDKGDAAELVLDGRLIGERTEEVNLAELLRVAHREFDAKTQTIDEALLHAQWPALRNKLAAAMVAWDEGCGVPVGSPVLPNARYTPQARAIRYAAPKPPALEPDEPTPSVPRFEIPDSDVQTPVAKPGQPEWKARIAERAQRLQKLRARSSNLWESL